MIRIVYTLFFLIVLTSVARAQSGYEQVAFSYFLEEIFPKKFTNEKSAEFDCKTKKEFTYLGHVDICFKDESNLEEKLKPESGTSDTTQIELSSKGAQIKIVKVRPMSKRVKLSVLKSIKVNGLNYVLINVYKKDHYVDHYLLEISNENKILRWCSSEEII